MREPRSPFHTDSQPDGRETRPLPRGGVQHPVGQPVRPETTACFNYPSRGADHMRAMEAPSPPPCPQRQPQEHPQVAPRGFPAAGVSASLSPPSSHCVTPCASSPTWAPRTHPRRHQGGPSCCLARRVEDVSNHTTGNVRCARDALVKRRF